LTTSAAPGVAPRLAPSVDLLLAALLGALHSLAFVHTAAWPLQLASVAAPAWRASAAGTRRAAGMGLLFGTAWLGAGTWWLFISLHTYGGLPAWLAVVAITALSAFLSLYLAAALAAFARWRSGVAWRDALLFGAGWLLAELARGVIFTGFPWVASGYAHVDGPLAALAPWIGVYGMGFVGAVLAAWLAFGWRSGWRARGASLAAFALVLGAGALFGPGRFSQPAGTLSVTLLQGNVAQDEKFAATAMPQALDWTLKNLLAARGELVVAPETVIPLLPSQLDPAYWAALVEHFQRGPRAVLLGLPLGDQDVGYTNSAAGISAATASLPSGYYRYDKHHLVPFGEFIPFGFRWFTELMNIPLGDFNRGPVGAASFAFRGQRIGANICYEDLFGEELAARFAAEAQAPTIFANISNIGWFGDTIAIDQHLQISRMRALEFQRPMLRATNTGATVVIDHTGRVTAALPRYTQGVLDARVEGRTGLTPFAWWAARVDLWPLWALGFLILVISARRARGGRDALQ
jgi:apolipoprotein N-acyltransferase